MSITETLSARIAKSFFGYLHLGSWLDVRVKSLASGRAPQSFKSVDDFWLAVLQEKLHHGDRIKFKSAFLTEWIPRLPSAPWHHFTDHAAAPNLHSLEYLRLEVLRKGKVNIVSQTFLKHAPPLPLGVVRLRMTNDPHTCACLCLTTVDAWCCDLGIPIVVSSSVYDAFVARREGSNAVEADLEGVLQFGEMPLLGEKFLRTMGVDVDSDFLRSVVTLIGLPYIFLRITSPLDVRMRTHNSAPPAFLWSISRKWITHEFTRHKSPDSREWEPVKETPTDPHWGYDFLLAPYQPDDPDSIHKCVRSFARGDITSWIPGLVGRPSDEMVEVLTEFDARVPHFSTAVPLVPAPWKQPPQRKRIPMLFKNMEERALTESRTETDTEQEPERDK